jgi:hypothetical protein
MRRLVAILLLLAAGSADARDLVLVVRADSPVTEMDSLTVRKLFMGFSVTAGNRPLRAIRLGGDHALDSVFLQSVVGMSATQYEHRLLRMAVKQGRAAPSVTDNAAELVGALREDTRVVGCLWADQITGRSDLRIVRLLWRG